MKPPARTKFLRNFKFLRLVQGRDWARILGLSVNNKVSTLPVLYENFIQTELILFLKQSSIQVKTPLRHFQHIHCSINFSSFHESTVGWIGLFPRVTSRLSEEDSCYKSNNTKWPTVSFCIPPLNTADIAASFKFGCNKVAALGMLRFPTAIQDYMP